MGRYWYYFAQMLGLAAAAPWLAARFARGRYRSITLARLGLGSSWLNIPPRPGGIWLHALSVGEVRSALPLVRRLARNFPGKPLIFSVATAQGMAMAQEQLANEPVTLLVRPIDVPWAVDRVVGALRPSLFCLVEGDIWPAWNWALAKRGVPSILINGRVSPRTFKGYRRLGPMAKGLLNGFDRILVQTATDFERLDAVGIDPSKLQIGGNLKFDSAPEPLSPEQASEMGRELGLDGRTVFVAGSTHEGEEEPCLDALAALKRHEPNTALLLAPREIHRGGAVAALARQRGFSVAQVSEGTPPPGCDVVVLDVLGRLAQAYALGRAAFVGGSLCNVGGHNLLEPAAHGVPVVFGTIMHNFKEMSEDLEKTGGAVRIERGGELVDVWQGFLQDPGKAKAMGQKAREFCLSHRGALDKVVAEISSLMESRDAR